MVKSIRVSGSSYGTSQTQPCMHAIAQATGKKVFLTLSGGPFSFYGWAAMIEVGDDVFRSYGNSSFLALWECVKDHKDVFLGLGISAEGGLN